MTSLGLHGFLGYYIECSIASGGGASSPLKGHNATWQPLVELAIIAGWVFVSSHVSSLVGERERQDGELVVMFASVMLSVMLLLSRRQRSSFCCHVDSGAERFVMPFAFVFAFWFWTLCMRFTNFLFFLLFLTLFLQNACKMLARPLQKAHCYQFILYIFINHFACLYFFASTIFSYTLCMWFVNFLFFPLFLALSLQSACKMLARLAHFACDLPTFFSSFYSSHCFCKVHGKC